MDAESKANSRHPLLYTKGSTGPHDDENGNSLAEAAASGATMSSKEGGRKDLDYVLEHVVGGFGRWQLLNTLTMIPMLWMTNYPLFVTIFTLYEPKHRCFVQECEDNGTNYVDNITESWVEFAIPKEHKSTKLLSMDGAFSGCHRYAPSEVYSLDGSSCAASSFSANATVACQSGYVYETEHYSETFTSRMNLVCDDAYKRSILSTCLMAGLLVGSMLGGRCIDRLGRKRSMLVGAALIIPSLLAGGFCPHLEAYAVLRFVSSTALPIVWIASHTYGLEVFSPNNRKYLIAMKDVPFGEFVLAFFAHFIRHWQWLHVCLAVLSAAMLPLYLLLPESPRWLAANGRHDEAVSVFEDIADRNRKDLNDHQRKEIRSIVSEVEAESDSGLSPLDMFRHGLALKTLTLMLQWVTVCVGFFALMLNSESLHGDPVLNYVLGVVADLPSFLLVFVAMDGAGRRWTLFATQLVLAVSTIALAFVPKSMSTLVLILYLLGRTAGASGFSMVYLVTAEVYPTNLRAQAVGTCSMVARTFGLCAGFVGRLATIWTPLPMLVLGVPSLLAAGLALTLTETSGVDLPQNMAEAERMEKGGRTWTDLKASFQGWREKQIIKTTASVYKE